MTVDISNTELARRIDEVVREMREDLADTNRRVEATASQNLNREVYEARHSTILLRMDRVESEQRRMSEEIRAKEMALQLEEKKKEEIRQSEQRANRRMVIASGILPAVLMAVTIILNFMGPV